MPAGRLLRHNTRMQRVHIVGISPRSGTTLLAELMVSCFEFDGWAEHEMGIHSAPSVPVARFCSKQPAEVDEALRALRYDPNLWVICMLRDPRDVVVSRHRRAPDAYWAHLGFVKRRAALLQAGAPPARFLLVRYEDLVSDPDAVQARIEREIPFLVRRSAFSAFHKVAAPSEKSVLALNGVRRISTDSIGRWRQELPRLKAQIERHGSIDDLLIRFGYEKDAAWASVLDGVTPNNGRSFFEDKPPQGFVKTTRRRLRGKLLELRARAGLPRREPVRLNRPD